MGNESGVEEWLPGGIRTRKPSGTSADVLEFTPGRRSLSNGDREFTVDLNEVAFEGLLALGVSVAQAARFISQRERHGGISTLREVDAFHGLDPDVRSLLRRRGRV